MEPNYCSNIAPAAGCYISSTGDIHLIQVYGVAETAIVSHNSVPRWWLSEIKIQNYLIAPAYKAYLTRKYNVEIANKFIQVLTRHLEHCKIYQVEPGLLDDDSLKLD